MEVWGLNQEWLSSRLQVFATWEGNTLADGLCNWEVGVGVVGYGLLFNL